MSRLSHTPVPLDTPLVTEEKIRGAFSSAIAGSISTGLNVFGVTVLGLNAPLSLIVMYYIFGGFVAYICDIIIAKYKFHGVHVPYTELGPRFMWLLSSFTDRFFVRFVVSIVIEALTAVALLDAVIITFDHYGIWTEGRARTWRNLLLAVAVAAFIYVLFGNVLRYDWSLSETEHHTLNIVVMVWVAMAILVFARGTTVESLIGDANGNGNGNGNKSKTGDTSSSSARSITAVVPNQIP